MILSVLAPVFLFKCQVLSILGGLAPRSVENLRRSTLLGIGPCQGLALVPCLVLRVAPRPGIAHLEVLPRDVYPHEVTLRLVIQEAFIDVVSRLFGRLGVLEAP